MGENAELLAYNNPQSTRITLTNWLIRHNVDYDDAMSNEELRQLYIRVECGQV